MANPIAICDAISSKDDHCDYKCLAKNVNGNEKYLKLLTNTSAENRNTDKKDLIVCGYVRNFWKLLNYHTTSCRLANAPKDLLQCVEKWLVFSDSWDISLIASKDMNFKQITLNNDNHATTKQHIVHKQVNILEPCTIFGNIVVKQGHKQVWRLKILPTNGAEDNSIPSILVGIIDVDLIPRINWKLLKHENEYDMAAIGGYGLSTKHGLIYHGRFTCFTYPKWVCYPKDFRTNTEIIIELDLTATRNDRENDGILRYVVMDENGEEISNVIIDKQIDLQEHYKLFMTVYDNKDQIALIQQ